MEDETNQTSDKGSQTEKEDAAKPDISPSKPAAEGAETGQTGRDASEKAEPEAAGAKPSPPAAAEKPAPPKAAPSAGHKPAAPPAKKGPVITVDITDDPLINRIRERFGDAITEGVATLGQQIL